MVKKINIVMMLCMMLFAAPNSFAKPKNAPHDITIEFPTRTRVSERYGNLDYGIRIQVRSDVRDNKIVNLNDLTSKEAADVPSINMDYGLVQSTEQYLDNYATGLGLKVGAGESTYVLRVTITDCNLRIREYNVKKRLFSSSAVMTISWELLNSEGQNVLSPCSSMGRGTARGQAQLTNSITDAFEQSLSDIDWDRIASQLKIAKTARQEKNKAVTGEGNTALEHTVIRWYIISTPQGADVSWRVVSSTPDVANTNANFVGNTPYESTETFDIKGLTFNNSGNVQIEVTCEKVGYITQKRRFNLRQAIEQKEISAKFNLVKEDE